jgi:hypothetical protein
MGHKHQHYDSRPRSPGWLVLIVCLLTPFALEIGFHLLGYAVLSVHPRQDQVRSSLFYQIQYENESFGFHYLGGFTRRIFGISEPAPVKSSENAH